MFQESVSTGGSQIEVPLDHGVHCSQWDRCNCGMVPTCCRLYHPDKFFDVDNVDRSDLASGAKAVKRALRDMPDKFKWEFIHDWPPKKRPKKQKSSKYSKTALEGTEGLPVQKKSRKEGKSKFQDKNKAKYNKCKESKSLAAAGDLSG